MKKGHIENDYGGPFRLSEQGRTGTLSGSTGGPEVKLDVDRGEIRIRKASSEDAPAPPKPQAPPKAPLEVTRQ